jgi:hypothetical protein
VKLRIKDDSIRFRVPPSGVKTLMATGKLTAQVRFSLSPFRALTYALVLDDAVITLSLEFDEDKITARLPIGETTRWAESNEVAIRSTTELDSSSMLTLLIEKDFACLDLSDEENKDTFPNPNHGQVC